LPVGEAPFTAGLACQAVARSSRSAAPGREPAGWIRRVLPVAVILLPLVLCGCAYFNTFHHAKKAYAKARRVEAKSKSDKLSPEAVRHYDTAIEKSAKVIFEHGGGWRAGIDDALFLMGASYYGKREYETAVKKFGELVINYPDSDHVPEALFYTGLCYYRMRNHALAERTFERVLRDHPDFERKDEILFTTAEALETSGEYEKALRQYRRLLSEYGSSEKREDVLEKIGGIHFEAGRFDSALSAYAELARYTQDDELHFEVQLRAGACLVRMGEHDRALDVYRRILPDEPERNEKAGRVWLAMAEAENRRGGHEKALEYLGRVTEHFEKRGVGVEAAFLTGYTYETYLHDYDLAREHYEEVTGSVGSSVFKDQAARRLKNLKYMEEMRAVVDQDQEEADLERRAEAALKVAEFSLFEGQDPRTAVEQYDVVTRDFAGSSSAIRASYGRALVLYRDLDSLQAAARVFREVVTNHPASAQATRAVELLEELGESPEAVEPLRRLVHQAQAEVARADSIAAAEAARVEAARADSLAAVQTEAARADSVAAAEAAALAAPATPPSLAVAEGAVDSVAAVTALDSLAPSELAGRIVALPDSVSATLKPFADSTEVPGEALAPDAQADSLRESELTFFAHPDSADAPVDSTDAAADSAGAPVDSTDAAADSADAPVDSTAAPADSSGAAVDSLSAERPQEP
jgi:tetratricopeptide (TPR) repeat protein